MYDESEELASLTQKAQYAPPALLCFVKFGTSRDTFDLILFFASVVELLIWQVHQFELGCIKLHTSYRYKVHPKLYSDWSMFTVFINVCVCFLPIHSGHQVRWTYQSGSHRRKVTQDFSSTFLRCVPSFFSRERFSHSFPSSTVKSNVVY